MKRVKTTPAGLATALRQMATVAPQALEEAMVDGAMQLQGSLVQKAIASTDPQPVDQGQYKAAWGFEPIPGGALVGNASKQALWIERGRAPGPVPYGPILAWVRRKGFVKAQAKATAKAGQRRATKTDIEQAEAGAAFAIQKKISERGIEPRWVLRRAVEALRSRLPRLLQDALRRAL